MLISFNRFSLNTSISGIFHDNTFITKVFKLTSVKNVLVFFLVVVVLVFP